MANINERHRMAAFTCSGSGRSRTSQEEVAYAEGVADREAEIADNLRRRDQWGHRTCDSETADAIEQGLDSQWGKPTNKDFVDLLSDFCERSECDLDHDGACQEHNWFGDGECPHARARRMLEAANG